MNEQQKELFLAIVTLKGKSDQVARGLLLDVLNEAEAIILLNKANLIIQDFDNLTRELIATIEPKIKEEKNETTNESN